MSLSRTYKNVTSLNLLYQGAVSTNPNRILVLSVKTNYVASVHLNTSVHL